MASPPTRFRPRPPAPPRLFTTALTDDPSLPVAVSELADVYPRARHSYEESLNAETISQGINVSGPLHIADPYQRFDWSAYKEQRAALKQRLWAAPLAPGHRRAPRPLPTTSVVSREFREAWLNALADPQSSLTELSHTVPAGLKGQPLVDEMIARKVNVVRALWFIRIVYRSSVLDTNKPKLANQQRARVWTDDAKKMIEAAIIDCAQCKRTGVADMYQRALHRYHYTLALVQLSYREGLVQRVKFADWLVEMIATLYQSLALFPSSQSLLTNATLSASLSLWSVRCSLSLSLINTYGNSIVQSRYLSYKLCTVLVLIIERLSSMEMSDTELLSHCRKMKQNVTHQYADNSPQWESIALADANTIDDSDSCSESMQSNTTRPSLIDTFHLTELLLPSNLLLTLETASHQVRTVELLASLLCEFAHRRHYSLDSYQPVHTLVEWCCHGYYQHHSYSIAVIHSLLTRTVAMAGQWALAAHSWIAGALLVVLQHYQSQSRACQMRLVALLTRCLHGDSPLFDYDAYTATLLSIDPLNHSEFTRLLLLHLPCVQPNTAIKRQWRKMCLESLTSSIEQQELSLYWHCLSIIVDRMPIIYSDAFAEVRLQCAHQCRHYPVTLLGGSKHFPLIAEYFIDIASQRLLVPNISALLSLLPLPVIRRCLQSLVQPLIHYIQSLPPLSFPSPCYLYAEQVLRLLLYYCEMFECYSLLFSLFFTLIPLSAHHQLQLECVLFHALRRSYTIIEVGGRLEELRAALVAAIAGRSVKQANDYLASTQLPLIDIDGIIRESQSQPTPTTTSESETAASTPAESVSVREIFIAYRSNVGNDALAATLASLSSLPLDESLTEDVLKEIFLVLTTNSGNQSSQSLHYMQDLNDRCRLAELCAIVRVVQSAMSTTVAAVVTSRLLERCLSSLDATADDGVDASGTAQSIILFLSLGVSRGWLSLLTLVSGVVTAVRASPFTAPPRLSLLSFLLSAHRTNLWDADSFALDATIQAHGDQLLNYLQELFVLLRDSDSSDSLDGIISSAALNHSLVRALLRCSNQSQHYDVHFVCALLSCKPTLSDGSPLTRLSQPRGHGVNVSVDVRDGCEGLRAAMQDELVRTQFHWQRTKSSILTDRSKLLSLTNGIAPVAALDCHDAKSVADLCRQVERVTLPLAYLRIKAHIQSQHDGEEAAVSLLTVHRASETSMTTDDSDDGSQQSLNAKSAVQHCLLSALIRCSEAVAVSAAHELIEQLSLQWDLLCHDLDAIITDTSTESDSGSVSDSMAIFIVTAPMANNTVVHQFADYPCIVRSLVQASALLPSEQRALVVKTLLDLFSRVVEFHQNNQPLFKHDNLAVRSIVFLTSVVVQLVAIVSDSETFLSFNDTSDNALEILAKLVVQLLSLPSASQASEWPTLDTDLSAKSTFALCVALLTLLVGKVPWKQAVLAAITQQQSQQQVTSPTSLSSTRPLAQRIDNLFADLHQSILNAQSLSLSDRRMLLSVIPSVNGGRLDTEDCSLRVNDTVIDPWNLLDGVDAGPAVEAALDASHPVLRFHHTL